MQNRFSVILVMVALFISSGLVASEETSTTMVLNYDGFFDRMDDLDEADYVEVKLAFYFNEVNSNNPCPIRSAKLKTKLKEMQVYYLDDGEVLLPFDEQLDMDKAELLIETVTGFNCGLNMRLENSFLLTETIESKRLLELVTVFDEALHDLGGMMSFLVPDVTGITVMGMPNTVLSIVNGRSEWCSSNRCQLTATEMMLLGDHIKFSAKPAKILPYIEK